jgi:hypothetical protein
MRSGGRGSAGGGGRGKGGKSRTGSAAAVAGVIGAAAAPAAGLPAAAAVPASPANMAKAAAAPTPAAAAKPKGMLDSISAVASREPPGGLLLAEKVRAEAGAAKPAADFAKQDAFDREALRLARDEKVVLHYHDAPGRLPKEELAGMVYSPEGDTRAYGVSGTWFIGMARRRGT